MLLLIPSSLAAGVTNIDKYISNVEKHYNLPTGIISAIIKVESGGKILAINHNDGTSAQKSKGMIVKSLGLMQIQLATAKHMGFKGNYKELLNPIVNIEYGGKYLRWLLDKNNNNIAQSLGCFNSGPNSEVCRKQIYTQYVGKILNALYK
jgi:soluble lytic murein transglycosylase-like protein